MNEFINDRKNMNRLGFATLALFIFTDLSSEVLPQAVLLLFPGLSQTVLESISYISLLLELPAFYALVYLLPRGVIAEKRQLSLGKLLTVFIIGLGVSYALNYLIYPVNELISTMKEAYGVAPSVSYYDSVSVPGVIYTVLAAPIVEELVFRKLMLDRLRPMGDGVAIIFTSLAFGMYHMNMQQLLFAAWWGIVLSYVVMRTGTIKYSVILHIMVNTLGAMFDIAGGYIADAALLNILTSVTVLAVIAVGLILLVRAVRRGAIVISQPILPIHRRLFTAPGVICALIFAILANGFYAIIS